MCRSRCSALEKRLWHTLHCGRWSASSAAGRKAPLPSYGFRLHLQALAAVAARGGDTALHVVARMVCSAGKLPDSARVCGRQPETKAPCPELWRHGVAFVRVLRRWTCVLRGSQARWILRCTRSPAASPAHSSRWMVHTSGPTLQQAAPPSPNGRESAMSSSGTFVTPSRLRQHRSRSASGLPCYRATTPSTAVPTCRTTLRLLPPQQSQYAAPLLGRCR